MSDATRRVASSAVELAAAIEWMVELILQVQLPSHHTLPLQAEAVETMRLEPTLEAPANRNSFGGPTFFPLYYTGKSNSISKLDLRQQEAMKE